MKKIISFFILAILFSIPCYAFDKDAYENYNYLNESNLIVKAPQAYVIDDVIYSENLQNSLFNNPEDIFVSKSGTIYLLDSKNKRIVIWDKNFICKKIINGFKNDTFKQARGLFVFNDKEIYIADTARERIVVLDINGNLIKILKKPTGKIIGKDFIYKPLKLVVDAQRRIYVISDGCFQGIISLDNDGKFLGYFGVNEVRLSALDLFWRRFSTKAQRDVKEMFVPTDNSNLFIDEDNFIYTTMNKAQDGKLVKKLNMSGVDIIRSLSTVPISGDPYYEWNGQYKGLSVFCDIAYNQNGFYACLDSKRGRVFVYDNDGFMLYNFGNISPQKGGFISPTAIDYLGDKIIVLDKGKNCISVFKPTDYAKEINFAITAQKNSEYTEAFDSFKKVLKLNSNFELAHIAIGKMQMKKEQYKDAIESFKNGHNKVLYSSAFYYYRMQIIKKNFDKIVIGLFVVVVLLFVFIYRKKFKALFVKK